MNRLLVWIPLALFALFCGVAAYQLSQPADDRVASGMIGKPLPDFELPPATEALPGIARADFTDGTPRLLNIWASWCVPCVAEAPQLEQLEARGAEIVGVALRDEPEDVARFLERYGNPYTHIGADNLSALQVAIGSSGVPETFVIDGSGVITYQHIGDIRERDVPVLLAELAKAGT
ncbi:MAG: DsbE family thiol:disulfide interchange protein [Parerythrobacter sp.]